MARDDGVPMDLRERIARRYFGVLYADKGVEHEFTIAATHYYAVTDAILAEIERSGYRLVEAGRLERLQSAAGRYLEYCEGGGWDPLHREPSPIAMAGLQAWRSVGGYGC